MVQPSHLYITTENTIALTIRTFVGKVMSLLFNMLLRSVIAFFPRSKCFNFMAAVTTCNDFGDQENKICHCFYFSLIYLPLSDGTGCHDLSFVNIFKVSPSSRGSLVLHFLPLEWHHLHIWDCWYFSEQSWFQLVIHPASHFTWWTLHIS